MKKLFISLIFMLSFQFWNAQVSGQNTTNLPKIGIGITILNISDIISGGYINNLGNTICIPVNVTDKFRFEPEIGFVSVAGNSYSSFGVGFFGMKNSTDLLLKYGIRAGLNSESYYTLAPTLGGEYFLSRQFSLGAEVQLKMVTFNSETLWMTSTLASIRFYFK
jgi:hypothetical protein